MKVTKITWRSVSCPLTDYFSNSIKFIYYQYYINQIAKNLSSLTLLIFEVFVLISFVINLSLNETLTIFLLYGKQNLDDTIDSSNFSVRHYLHFIWNIYVAHMQNFKIYVKEGHPFVHVFSLENSEDSYSCFWMALLHSPSYFVSI